MFTVYSKSNCQACKATIRKLDKLGADYITVDIETDMNAYIEATSHGYLEAPVIVAPSGATWSGYRPDQLTAEHQGNQ